MSDAERNRLAVLGSPIAHSRSPRIHQVAYEALGLDWHYEAIDLPEEGFSRFFSELGPEWRGFSITMPLKNEAFQLSAERDAAATATESVNTLLRNGGGWAGFNTDVPGIIACVEKLNLQTKTTALVLGAGATAASVIYSLSEMGFENIYVAARRSAQASELAGRFSSDSLRIKTLELDELFAESGKESELMRGVRADLLVNTLPGEASGELALARSLTAVPALFDINYDPWPTPLASRWEQIGVACVNGLELLVQQALLQVRIFVNGDPARTLPNEVQLLRAMQQASMKE